MYRAKAVELKLCVRAADGLPRRTLAQQTSLEGIRYSLFPPSQIPWDAPLQVAQGVVTERLHARAKRAQEEESEG